LFIIDIGITQKLELTLKLTLDSTAANVISAWEDGTVRVGDTWYPGHLILTPETIIKNWQVTLPENLRLSHLEPVINLDPEIIIVGTGMQLIFPNTKLTRLLAEKKIGLEIMDTPAACRTYNVLVHEGRRVAVALFNK